jgi:hypothetical protein
MDQMLDSGFWILDLKRSLSLFSSIQYLVSRQLWYKWSFSRYCHFWLWLARVMYFIFVQGGGFFLRTNCRIANDSPELVVGLFKFYFELSAFSYELHCALLLS